MPLSPTRSAVLIGLLLSIGGCVPLLPGPTWQQYSSPECKFSAMFPGAVQTDEKKSVKHFHTPLYEGQVDFRVAYSLIGDPPGGKTETLAFLHSIRDKVAKQGIGRVLQSRDLQIEGEWGIEFKMTRSKEVANTQLTCRYLVVEDRFYQMIVSTPAGTDRTREAKRFFDSFKLLSE